MVSGSLFMWKNISVIDPAVKKTAGYGFGHFFRRFLHIVVYPGEDDSAQTKGNKNLPVVFIPVRRIKIMEFQDQTVQKHDGKICPDQGLYNPVFDSWKNKKMLNPAIYKGYSIL